MSNNLGDNLASLKSEVKDELEDITDIGVVHDHERNVREPDDFIKAFAYKDSSGRQWAVRGWELLWTSSLTDREVFPRNLTRDINFVLRGYHSIEDVPDEKNYNSEALFDALINAVISKLSIWAIDTSKTTKQWCSPPDVTIRDNREKADQTVHYCEITFAARVRSIMESESSTDWTVQP